MSDPLLSSVAATQEQARAAGIEVFRAALGIIRRGRLAVLEVREAEEPVRIAQRGLLHAGVLPQIAEQANLGGQRYTVSAWKELFRTMFLPKGGMRWRESSDPFYCPKRKRTIKPRKPRVIKERISTEELGVAGYARFTEEIIQYAAHELGVHFVFTREQDDHRARHHRPPATRKA